MHIERELLNLGENISVALAPILVPVEELLRDPRDLQLLDTADERLNAGHPETAVVLAQTAVEVMADWALRVALRLSMPEGAVEPLLNVLPDRTFMDRRTRTVLTSLTGDVLSEMETWKSYHGHVERRNRVAPAGFQPTEEDARASIDVCERLVIHLQNVI